MQGGEKEKEAKLPQTKKGEETDRALAGAIGGAIVGAAVGGAPGAIIGGLLGFIAVSIASEEEKKRKRA